MHEHEYDTMLVGIAIILLIGVAQGLGHDPLRIKWIGNLISSAGSQENGLTFNNENTHNTYLTLYNSNYVGVYSVMLVPLLVGFLFIVQILALNLDLEFFKPKILVDSVHLYRRITSHNYLTILGMAISGGVIGFLLMGMTNDSLNGITAIFYLLLGMGTGINYMVKRQQKG